MFGKRGLSQVVTTVLIILLVLVAVLIIWGFVRPTIEGAGERVGAECLTVDLEVVGCPSNVARVQRHSGAGTLEGIQLILNGNLCSGINPPGNLVNELAMDNFNCGATLLQSNDKVEAAAVVTGGQLCQPSRAAFTCP